MNFRTEISLLPASFNISHEQKILLAGSCFAENMHRHLNEHKFQTLLNPFGILFNPVSISNSIERVIENRFFEQNELVHHAGLWHSMEHHGSFSHPDSVVVLKKINEDIEAANRFLKETNVLLLTLGSAIVFEYKSQQRIVANCHKIPNTEFERKLLSVEEVVTSLSSVFDQLKRLNPALKIIVTVSPVRYLSHGFVENQLSKATLLLALQELQNRFDNTHYFPAYELVMDDLRDYRFFKEDMIHPNETAVKYIWEQFAHCFFDEETKRLNVEIETLTKAMNHRPFNPETEEYKLFLKANRIKLNGLKLRLPTADWSAEEAFFKT